MARAQAIQDAQQGLYDLAQAELDRLARLRDRVPDMEQAAGVQAKLEGQLDEARERARAHADATERLSRIGSDISAHVVSQEGYERRIEVASRHTEIAAQAPVLQTRLIEVSAAIAAADVATTDLKPFEAQFDQLVVDVADETVELAMIDQQTPTLYRLRWAMDRAIKRGQMLIELYGVRLDAADPAKRMVMQETREDTQQRLDRARAAVELITGIPLWEEQVEELSETIVELTKAMSVARTEVDAAREAQSEVDALRKCITDLGGSCTAGSARGGEDAAERRGRGPRGTRRSLQAGAAVRGAGSRRE